MQRDSIDRELARLQPKWGPAMIDPDERWRVTDHRELRNVARSTVRYRPEPVSAVPGLGTTHRRTMHHSPTVLRTVRPQRERVLVVRPVCLRAAHPRPDQPNSKPVVPSSWYSTFSFDRSYS